MKYLKLFESISMGYESISATQLVNTTSNYVYPDPNNKFKSNNFIPFSEQSLNLIRKFGYRVNIDHNNNVSLCAPGSKLAWERYRMVTSIIRQLPDEWFYVDIFLRPKYLTTTNGDGSRASKRLCYKCDQIDGVIKCLEDNLPINEGMKVFESSEIYKGYSKIEKSEYSSITIRYAKDHTTPVDKDKEMVVGKLPAHFGVINWVPLSEQELRILGDMLSENGYILEIKYNNRIAIYRKSRGSVKKSKQNLIDINNEIGYINQIDDEWFIVNIPSGFYKCDQISGVVECIEENLSGIE